METLIIGTGPMALAYAEVLKDMNITFCVVGRGQSTAEKFEQTTGVSPVIGGIEKYVAEGNVAPNTQAIIATGTESLMKTLLLLLKAGVRKILVEKPAAISVEELVAHEEEIKSYSSKIYVAYNRRFYTSVLEAEKLVKEDGGLLSMQFEFTEWAHRIDPLEKAAGVKENWFFANSTHVVDLAFFLAGKPEKWKTYARAGNISWHSTSNFVGAGVTEKGVLFSYVANWESAGRWSIELFTQNRRIYLKPLESIWIQRKGSLDIEKHEYNDFIDQKYKPGLFNQVLAFIRNDPARLVSFHEHVRNSNEIYNIMLNVKK